MKIKPEAGSNEDEEDDDFDENIFDLINTFSSESAFQNYGMPSSSDGSKRIRMQTTVLDSTQNSSITESAPQLSKNAEQARLNRLRKKTESFQRKSLLSQLNESVKQSQTSQNALESNLKNQRHYNLYLTHLLQNRDNLKLALQNLPNITRIYARGFILPDDSGQNFQLPASPNESPLCLHIAGSTAQIELCKDCSQTFRNNASEAL